jgi:hypothetical protein
VVGVEWYATLHSTANTHVPGRVAVDDEKKNENESRRISMSSQSFLMIVVAVGVH